MGNGKEEYMSSKPASYLLSNPSLLAMLVGLIIAAYNGKVLMVILLGLILSAVGLAKLYSYLLAIIRATREHAGVELGASPRASLSLDLASRALAAVRGRNYVIPDDVKYLALPILGHRLIAKPEAKLRKHSTEAILEEILSRLPVPVEK